MAEQASAEVGEHLRAVTEIALDAYFEVDARGAITEWNPQAERTFGWSRAEAIGMQCDLFIPMALRDEYHQSVLACASPRVVAARRRFTITGIRRDKTEI